MDKIFPGFYRPDDDELRTIWRDCLFIFDTNVLLGLYRYPKEVHNEFLRTIKKLKKRIWIPHQVGFEYQTERIAVIADQLSKFDEIIGILNQSKSELIEKVSSLHLEKRHSIINTNAFIEKVTNEFSIFENNLNNLKKQQPDIHSKDLIREEIDQVLGDNVGPALTPEELNAIINNGKERYDHLQPPGYLDRNKNNQEKNFHLFNGMCIPKEYGDLIIWKQILTEIKNRKVQNVIFVTDDNKEDWWWIYKGKTLGPRPELVHEIKLAADIKTFYMYDSARFLQFAKEFLGEEIKQDTINQVEEIMEFHKLNRPGGGPNSYSSILHSQLKNLIRDWLLVKSRNVFVEENNVYPDLLLSSGNKKIAYEIKILREVRTISIRLRELLYKGAYEVSVGKFDEFVFILTFKTQTINLSMLDHELSKLKLPNGVRIELFEYYYENDKTIKINPIKLYFNEKNSEIDYWINSHSSST